MDVAGAVNSGALLGTIPAKQTPSFTEQSQGQVYVLGATTRSTSGSTSRSPWLAPLFKEHTQNSAAFYKKVRLMRQHPTVRLTRNLSVAVMAEADWSVESQDDADESIREYLTKHVLPLQHDFMGPSLRGTFDYGWQAFEKVFSYNIEERQIVPQKLKTLLQDQTEIVVRQDTGAYAGVMQYNLHLTPTNALLINRDVEGTYFYGEGAMPSIEFAFNRWMNTDDANVRFDCKLAGAHWVVYYPLGNSDYGQYRQVDNHIIARYILQALEGSGSVVLPNSIKKFTQDLSRQAGGSSDREWTVELLETNAAQQTGFQQRLAYLDTLMVRAGGFPERSILEGQYGTKAESEAHADFAVSRMDYENKEIVRLFNKYYVDQLIGLNFGAKAIGKCFIKIAPIADDKISMLKQVYLNALSNPSFGTNELASIDMEALRDQVGIPAKSEEEMMMQQQQQMQGGPDYTNGFGVHGGSDPMLRQYLAHLNAPEQTQPQLPQQMPNQMMGA